MTMLSAEDEIQPDHGRGARLAQALQPRVAHSLDRQRSDAEPERQPHGR